jgi:hypothetical protein
VNFALEEVMVVHSVGYVIFMYAGIETLKSFDISLNDVFSVLQESILTVNLYIHVFKSETEMLHDHDLYVVQDIHDVCIHVFRYV